jgi:uncharacterized membrane protein
VLKTKKDRFWEIDFLRGIAIIMMIFFHFLYDLNYFGIYNLDLYSGYITIYTYSIGVFFLLLVGISLTLSYNKALKKLTKKELQIKFLKRGLKIFGLGLIITVVTFFLLREGFIVFGVLHSIGISIILAYPLLKYRYGNLLFGIILIIAGLILTNFTFDFYWLVWLGFSPSLFYTIDYFPLLPYLGVVLIGVFLGNMIYPDSKRRFNIRNLNNRLISVLCFLGQNSLIIYFIHQPIILSILYLIYLM